eukprot:CAMPEP_0198343338 /NCGR_PEP_ID=MMETSP1450-20131203/59408_1 /TAXON_ID=753684 ORGANISM="Madagascaria erythrocladiodes, Strain CCMP3234" /NCGR_SAMPLE_ID=MMETSP1450 /ASSEMBLY_ACC=CAM_ASM_001115 /LENGTH=142 /DNA_ID=CAMNT_0044048499 /DNA_START=66 /DNA_END=491 /DNA_ORIENTATION=-
MIGIDPVLGLLNICDERGLASGRLVRGSGVTLPLRSGCCDAAVCIAVVHHYSIAARRRAAIAELARVVRPGGKVLVYVWTREQQRFAGVATRDGNLYVDWNLRPKAESQAKEAKVYKRLYHLFARGELEQLVADAAPTATIT